MYLKAIELAGFKSFAIRTRLEFDPGLTAIVGPNGSGKSNLTDAVRWVLGEQSSRTLRGQQMGDLIFAGSSEHRAVGMAEVLLLFDNSDYQLSSSHAEVAVARRLFRDGNSEYLLNGTPCRLRDIVELFTDTGLGRESFAIISQGQIDAILDERAEERRGIFEEAAGIARYRQRKSEAGRRLAKVAEQLTRVYDMLGLMRENEAILQAQADEARRYLDTQTDLQLLERSVYYHDLIELDGKLRTATQENELAESNLMKSRSDLAALEAEMVWQRESLSGLEDAQQQANQAIWSSRQERERLMGEQRLLEQKSEQQHSEAERRQEELERLERQAVRLEEELHLLENETTVARWQQSQGSQQLAELQKRRDIVEAKLRLLLAEQAERRSKLDDQGREAARQEMRLEQLNRDCDDLRRQQVILDERESDALLAERAAHAEHEKAKNEEENAATALQSLIKSLELAQSERVLCEEAVRAKQQSLSELRQKIAAQQSRQRLLQEMEEQREGYHRAVQQLLAARDRGVQELSGLIDVLTRVIEVPTELELALEAALGGSAQYLVCNGEGDAEVGIAWLKQHRAGRATFLPHDVRVSRVVTKPAVDEATPGFVGFAGDLVACEERFRPLIERQLGRILVMRDLPAALDYARRTGYRERLVTLQGEQIYANGSISGGSVARRDSSLLARPRLLLETEKEQEQLQQLLREGEVAVRQAETAVARSREKEAELHREEVQRERGLAQLREQGLARERDLEENAARRKAMQIERQDAERKLGELQVSLCELERQIPQNLLQRATRDEDERKMQHEQEQLYREQREIVSALSALQVRIEQQEQEHGRRAVRLQALQRQRAEDTEQAKVLKELNAKYSCEEDERRNRVLLLEERLLAAEEQQINNEAALRELMSSRGDLAARLAEHDQKLTGLRRAEERANRRTGETRLQLVRLEDERLYLERRLKEEYQLVPEQLLQEMEPYLQRLYFEEAGARLGDSPPAEDEWQRDLRRWLSARRQGTVEAIQSHKQELAAMGHVNLGAIEEVQRVQERVNQLAEQSEDLERAAEELQQLIVSLERLMSRQFTQSVAEISEVFGQIFRKLFSGGEASLNIENPDKPLEGGITIHVRLPGKKQTSLALFSGGERALTALALLLAITQIKAPPFCLLDEVETALDEANLERLASLLVSMSQSCQIIVITHRRPTMEAADSLIGITMQTRGVSTALAVKLNQVES